MAVLKLKMATQPTFYFIGVTTGKSSIMRVFPQWVNYLRYGDVAIKGIDCKIHDDPQVYRDVVAFIKGDPLSLGGLVTTHKMDLLQLRETTLSTLIPTQNFSAKYPRSRSAPASCAATPKTPSRAD